MKAVNNNAAIALTLISFKKKATDIPIKIENIDQNKNYESRNIKIVLSKI